MLQCEAYSPIRHLASILWPPWVDRDKAIFAMLTFALDGGGDENSDYLTVAGFASSIKDWDKFSAAWKARLDRDGIEFFRAVDANSFRGPFQHWHEREDRVRLRQSLFADLMDLIQSHAYRKFACTIINKAFRNSNNEMRQQFVESAYSLAARTCEKFGRHWCWSEWKGCPNMEIAFVFEAGDPGQNQGKLQERLRRDYGHIPPIFRPKKDTFRGDGVLEHGFIPLQAADWLAWEINRVTRDADAGKLGAESEMRWPMQQFMRKPIGPMGIYTAENFGLLDSMIELESKIVAWETQLGLNKNGVTLGGYDANAKGKAAR